jgi:hypothetical protein
MRKPNGIGSLGNARRYCLNQSFFEDINTEEKAYWLGFLSADGNVTNKSENCKQISIILKRDDFKHLEKFSKSLESNYPVHIYKNTCNIVITSNNLGNSLIALGVTPKKSFTLKFCDKVPEHLLRHYFRGLVDGDGCIHKRKDGFYDVSLVGTKSICESFKKWIESCGVTFRAEVKSIRRFYGIRFNGRKLPKSVLSLLYKNSSIYLDRKYSLCQEIIAI